jgi:hypothetical protein
MTAEPPSKAYQKFTFKSDVDSRRGDAKRSGELFGILRALFAKKQNSVNLQASRNSESNRLIPLLLKQTTSGEDR